MTPYQSRADWEARHLYNEPYPPWKFCTWSERLQKIAVAIALTLFSVGAFFAFFYIVGLSVERQGQWREDGIRCLKAAETGDEMKKCER